MGKVKNMAWDQATDFLGKVESKLQEDKTMIKVDVRSKDCLYITIGKWVIYIDNSTGEQIIDSWEE